MAPDNGRPPAPFSMLRSCFILLAVVLLVQMAMTVFGTVGCFWMIMQGRYDLGACANIGQMAREVFTEMLTAVLALLLAARNGNGKPPPKE